LRLFHCTHRDEAFAQSLLRDPVFHAVGKEFAPSDPVEGGCEHDSQISDAYAEFESEGSAKQSVAGASRLAVANGWRHREDGCFSKQIRGTSVILLVYEEGDSVALSIFGRIWSEPSCKGPGYI
jgi:hypothetical protein